MLITPNEHGFVHRKFERLLMSVLIFLQECSLCKIWNQNFQDNTEATGTIAVL